MTKKIYLTASVCAATLMMASAAFATPTVTLYGTFSDTVTGVTPSGDNAPTVSATGGNGIGTTYTVSNLGGGTVQNQGTFFTVFPAGSISNSCGNSCGGTDSADINVTLNFYNSAYTTLYGSVTDTALTTFNYSAQDDILCWQDGSVGGTAVTAHSAAGGTCSNVPGSGTTGYEKITVSLNGSTYVIDLGDWSDWNESPSISFQMTCYSNCGAGHQGNPVPEPLTLSLFGAGLAGAAVIRRRKKKAV